MARHTIYGPSGLKRTLDCPGSIRAVKEAISLKKIPAVDKSGPAAEEGTRLHDLIHRAVEFWLVDPVRRDLSSVAEDLARREDPDGRLRDLLTDAAKSMEAVFQHAGYERMPEIRKSMLMLGEQFVSMEPIYDQLPPEILEDGIFGTLDRLIYNYDRRSLYIIDYKFGRGPVDPIENDQLLAYTLMALLSVPELIELPPEQIFLVIIQPAVGPGLTYWETDLRGVDTWKETRLFPGLEKTVLGKVRVPSESSCRFCRVSGICEAQAAKYDHYFKNNPLEVLTSNTDTRELINSLGVIIPEMRQWLDALEAKLLEYVQTPEGLPDFKAVLGRKGTRKWIDEEIADKFLARQGVRKEDRTVTKIVTPAQAEKTLKRMGVALSAKAKTSMLSNIEQPEAKITWAFKNDPREALEFSDKKEATEQTENTGNPEKAEQTEKAEKKQPIFL